MTGGESPDWLPRGLSPLGHRDYLLYWSGLATTTIGRWVELTGVVWLVYELTGSPFLVGLLGAARGLPGVFLSLGAGVVADRVDQRALLLVTQGLALLASLGLATLVATGTVEVWHVYLQVVIQSAITSFDAAARQALFPRLVPRRRLPEAVTLSTTAGRVSKFIGPALAGLLIADLGESAPFFVNAASYPGLMVAVLCMSRLPPGPRATTSFGGEMSEGLRYILSAPVLSGLLKLEIVYGIFEMNPAMIAIVGREVLDAGPRALGLLLASPALGSLIGIAWLISVRGRDRVGRFSLCCTLLCSAAMVLFAISTHYLLSVVALAAVGLLDVMTTVTRNTIMQLTAPGHMRGRVMANMGVVTRGIAPLAETQSGAMASWLGSGIAVFVAAGIIGVATAVTAATNRQLWHLSLREPAP